MKKIIAKHKPKGIKALLALSKASFLAMLRNPTNIFFNFFFPFIFIVIFGSLNYENVTFSIGVREESLKEGTLYQALQ
ncbi:MAG: hypothetical protein PHW73_12890, partial [Atribacterota bacterium]|nr:hypothetical protein [Atribacterota bacterium]